MKQPLFEGVCTALVTPFQEGRPDLPMLARLIERQIEAKVPAIVIAGTTGEGATLSIEEKLRLFAAAARIADGRCRILAGTGCNDTAAAAALTEAAADTGADGVLCVTPYYNKGTPDGLRRHFEAILERSRLPVVLYNVPSRTCVDLSPRLLAELAKHPRCAGLKEANPDLGKLFRIRAEGADLPLYCGNDDRTVPFYAAGGSGVISVLSNVLPAESVRLCELCSEGRFAEAATLQTRLTPLIEALFLEVNPVPVKAAMALLKLPCGPCRLPLGEASPAVLSRLKALLSAEKA